MVGRPPYYIPAVGPPGTLAVMSTPDAQPGFAGITPSSSTWENRVAARIALTVGLDRPGLAAAKLSAPILFCVCEQDTVTPAATTLKHAARAPHAEIRRYPCGHFEIYVGELFERAVSDQTRFLTRTLGVASAPASP